MSSVLAIPAFLRRTFWALGAALVLGLSGGPASAQVDAGVINIDPNAPSSGAVVVPGTAGSTINVTGTLSNTTGGSLFITGSSAISGNPGIEIQPSQAFQDAPITPIEVFDGVPMNLSLFDVVLDGALAPGNYNNIATFRILGGDNPFVSDVLAIISISVTVLANGGPSGADVPEGDMFVAALVAVPAFFLLQRMRRKKLEAANGVTAA